MWKFWKLEQSLEALLALFQLMATEWKRLKLTLSGLVSRRVDMGFVNVVVHVRFTSPHRSTCGAGIFGSWRIKSEFVSAVLE